MDLWLHVGLNIFGTALIGASNYNMQCLSFPTRDEIDLAHSRGTWLDIGVPSIRNLRYIPWKRIMLWLLLGVSTLPLHLLWNSSIFSTLQNNDYTVTVVAQDFLQDTGLNCSSVSHTDYTYSDIICNMYAAAGAKTLERLEPEDCVKAYGNRVLSQWSNLIAVSNSTRRFLQMDYHLTYTKPNSTSLQAVFQSRSSQDWLCSADFIGKCNINSALQNASHWNISLPKSYLSLSSSNFPIDDCLAQSEREFCKLQFSLIAILIVVISNAVKLCAMIGALLIVKNEHIINIGDAVAAFLTDPDPYTMNRCLSTKNWLRSKVCASHGEAHKPFGVYKKDCKDAVEGGMWNDSKSSVMWAQAPSRKRLVLCISL